MSRFVKETLPLAAYGGGMGLFIVSLNNGINFLHQATTSFPVATLLIGSFEMASGGALLVTTFNHLKDQKAKFDIRPVAAGLVLGAAFGAAVIATTPKIDASISNWLKGTTSQDSRSLAP